MKFAIMSKIRNKIIIPLFVLLAVFVGIMKNPRKREIPLSELAKIAREKRQPKWIETR